MKRINLQVRLTSVVNFDTDVPEDLYEKLIDCYRNGYTLDKGAVIEEAVDVVEYLCHTYQNQDLIDFEFEIEDLLDEDDERGK